MNIYARIRKIEDPSEFKRLVDTILGAEYGQNYQSLKEWHDFGIDGYQRVDQVVYAFYCPRYPERVTLNQYRRKIASDIKKIRSALDKGKISFGVKEWIFVTPDDLPPVIIEFIQSQVKDIGLKSGALTAHVLASLLMKHEEIHRDFPGILPQNTTHESTTTPIIEVTSDSSVSDFARYNVVNIHTEKKSSEPLVILECTFDGVPTNHGSKKLNDRDVFHFDTIKKQNIKDGYEPVFLLKVRKHTGEVFLFKSKLKIQSFGNRFDLMVPGDETIERL